MTRSFLTYILAYITLVSDSVYNGPDSQEICYTNLVFLLYWEWKTNWRSFQVTITIRLTIQLMTSHVNLKNGSKIERIGTSCFTWDMGQRRHLKAAFILAQCVSMWHWMATILIFTTRRRKSWNKCYVTCVEKLHKVKFLRLEFMTWVNVDVGTKLRTKLDT